MAEEVDMCILLCTLSDHAHQHVHSTHKKHMSQRCLGSLYYLQVQVQLGKYKRAVEDINRRTAAGDDPFADPDQELEANTKHLMSAVATLPELTERKRTLDKHTNIATALLNEIKVC